MSEDGTLYVGCKSQGQDVRYAGTLAGDETENWCTPLRDRIGVDTGRSMSQNRIRQLLTDFYREMA